MALAVASAGLLAAGRILFGTAPCDPAIYGVLIHREFFRTVPQLSLFSVRIEPKWSEARVG
jgi:hypothetical protein